MKKFKGIVIALVCMFTLFTFTGCMNLNFNLDRPQSSESLYQNPLEVSPTATPGEIVETYIDSVVTIFVADSRNNYLGFGSGVCIYSGGYIATNYHVVELLVNNSSYSLDVYLNESREPLEAWLLWYNIDCDVAIIQCSDGDIPYVEMEDRLISPTLPIKPLETVIAIGTPIDFEYQNTYTIGNVSGQNRIAVAEDRLYQNLLQHTAAINEGNSGGPLFDSRGKLIALNTLGMDESNSMFFAVPIYPVILMLDRVVEANEKTIPEKVSLPKLNISCYDSAFARLSGRYEEFGDGVKIMEVQSGISFGKLKNNDILKKAIINEKTIDLKNMLYLDYALMQTKSGDVVTFNLIRNNINTNVMVTIA